MRGATACAPAVETAIEQAASKPHAQRYFCFDLAVVKFIDILRKVGGGKSKQSYTSGQCLRYAEPKAKCLLQMAEEEVQEIRAYIANRHGSGVFPDTSNGSLPVL
jgi:hypothetical protein